MSSLLLTGAGPSGAGGASFDPTTVAGLAAWWDASQLSLSNDDPVSSWTDESGNGLHATQAVAGQRPLFKTAIQNGKAGVLFDGSDDFLTVTAGADASRTMFVVAKSIGTTAGQSAIGTANTNAAYVGIEAGSTWGMRFTQAGGAAVYGGVVTNTTVITVKINSAASVDGYVDDGAAVNFDPNDQLAANDGINLGSRSTANFYSGYLFDVLVYDTALNDTDRAYVRDGLNTKWAVY